MTTLTLHRPTTLADRIVPRSLVGDALLVMAGAAFTAGLAQLVVPLWPVPVTGQTLAVLLVGSTLGALRGALSLSLYALVGVLGLPVFSEATSGLGILLGPTGGYILGFIAAAAIVGWLAERRWDRRFLKAGLTFVGGTVVTFAFGLPWLAAALGLDLAQTLEFGLYPFLIGGLVKAGIAAAVLPTSWWVSGRLARRR